MIHFRKSLDLWDSNFGMSSRPQLTRNKKNTGAWRSLQRVEAALQQGNKVYSNVTGNTQVFLISIPSKLPTGRTISSPGSCILLSGVIVIYQLFILEYIQTFVAFMFNSLLISLWYVCRCIYINIIKYICI